MTQTIPQTPDGESALIGSMMLSNAARAGGLEACATDDFFVPLHRTLFATIAQLSASETRVDSVTLAAASGVDVAQIRAVEAGTPSSAHWQAYVKLVTEAAASRRAIAFGDSVRAAGVAQDLESVRRLIDDAAESLDAGPDMVDPAPEVSDLAARDYERSWLVRGLLERGDRLILTGAEGWGKSTWLRQLAVQFAAGVHPVYRTRENPLTVLHVDVENSEAQCSRAYRYLLGKAGSTYSGRRLFVAVRPQGINLCSRPDQRWLEGLFAAHRPDVVVMGPLYKLFRGSVERSKQSEEAAEQTSSVLDRLRTRYQCALLLEAHSPHGESGDRANFRPTGSSLWLRWPEFGLGMRPVPSDKTRCEVRAWRGARETDRCWPTELVKGVHWPWEVPFELPAETRKDIA